MTILFGGARGTTGEVGSAEASVVASGVPGTSGWTTIPDVLGAILGRGAAIEEDADLGVASGGLGDPLGAATKRGGGRAAVGLGAANEADATLGGAGISEALTVCLDL